MLNRWLLVENCVLLLTVTFAGEIILKCKNFSTKIFRSATFYTNFGLCKLSEETRRSSPQSFRPAQRGTFYLENECAVCKLND